MMHRLLSFLLLALIINAPFSAQRALATESGIAKDVAGIGASILLNKLTDQEWGKQNTPGYEEVGDGLIGLDEAEDAMENAGINDDGGALGDGGASTFMLDPSIPPGSANNREEIDINANAAWLQNSYNAIDSADGDANIFSESYESCETYTTGTEIIEERSCYTDVDYDELQCTENLSITATTSRVYSCLAPHTGNNSHYGEWKFIEHNPCGDYTSQCPSGHVCERRDEKKGRGGQCGIGKKYHRYNFWGREHWTTPIYTSQCPNTNCVISEIDSHAQGKKYTYTCTNDVISDPDATLISEDFVIHDKVWTGCEDMRSNLCPVLAEHPQPAQTKVVSTYPYTTVWERSYDYACTNGAEIDATGQCAVHLADGCDFDNKVCLSTNSEGECTQFMHTFQCPTGEGLTEETICTGGDGYAVPGAGDTSYAPNEDFSEAFVAIALAGAVGQEMDNTDPPGLSLFEGEDYTCTQEYNSLGSIFSKQCCWSLFATGALNLQKSCSDEEYRLYALREKKRCLFSYTQRSFVNAGFFDWNGYENKRFKHFRCFDTVLGRILVQAAIEQGVIVPFHYLDDSYMYHNGGGNAGYNEPNPGGDDPYALTIDQLQSLDFEQIDLTPAFDFPTNIQANIGAGAGAIAGRVAGFYDTPPVHNTNPDY